jgi:hypothetical protein
VILTQIAENESFENYVFKKLRFENGENCLFKSQAIECFFENAKFKRPIYNFFEHLTAFLKITFLNCIFLNRTF